MSLPSSDPRPRCQRLQHRLDAYGGRARRRVRPFALLVACALVAVGAQAQLVEIPPATITPLLPAAPTIAAHPTPSDAAALTAPARAKRLQQHPLHGEQFWVREVAGDPAATKVVVIVPQFHRSSTHPIAWSSLGQAIAEVQRHIEALTTTLLLTEGSRCVGTEGSAAAFIPGSHELRRLAWWRQDLVAAEQRLREVLAGEGRAADDELETLQLVMNNALKERAAILDGVGALQARLDEGTLIAAGLAPDTTLDRFGLEDSAVNAKAVALVRERDALYRQLALLDTEQVSEVQTALGQMWVDEYPLYREATVGPLLDTLVVLDAQRAALMKEGADWPAQVMGRYTSLVRRVADDTIKPDDVEGTYAYYKEVADRLADGGVASADKASPRRRLSRAEKKRKRRLERKLAKLETAYERVTHAERDRIAARRGLERVNAPEHTLCSVVFGQGHTEGLKAALLAEAAHDGLGPIGVIVIEPFDL